MKPSLDNAYARIDRAQEHIAGLERKLSEFSRSAQARTAYPRSSFGAAGLYTFTYESDILEPLPVFGILIGETVYNMRSALDYLVFELALLDSGQVQEHTQFPIEDTEEGWNKNVKRYLKGVSPTHQAAIKLLQPFGGCQWTGTLRDISNPDRHRTLTIVRIRQLEVMVDRAYTRRPMEECGDLTLNITFDDMTPVIETLHVLKPEVSNVVGAFRSEFK